MCPSQALPRSSPATAKKQTILAVTDITAVIFQHHYRVSIDMSGDYKDLRVWQDARILVREVYCLTRPLPKEETFGLVSQMRRSAVSVPSNIAQGKGRHSQRELAQFLYRAGLSTGDSKLKF